MRKYDDFLNEQLQDEAFRKEYEDMQPEFDEIRTAGGGIGYDAQN